jgi:hypothetical protein
LLLLLWLSIVGIPARRWIMAAVQGLFVCLLVVGNKVASFVAE